MVRKKRGLALVAAAVMTLTAACGSSEDESSAENSSSASASGMSGIPDVVAEVNGEEIPKSEFVEIYQAQKKSAEQQAQQGGQAPQEKQLREQVVQAMVTEELLRQEAERRDISPSDKQVQGALDEAAQQNGMPSADQLVKALQEQGLSREEIDEKAMQQAQFDLLVAEETGEVTATDKQVRDLYAQLKKQQAGAGQQGQQAQQIPPLKQVRSQLEEQVVSQQESEAARSLIDQLRKDADITVNV